MPILGLAWIVCCAALVVRALVQLADRMQASFLRLLPLGAACIVALSTLVFVAGLTGVIDLFGSDSDRPHVVEHR